VSPSGKRYAQRRIVAGRNAGWVGFVSRRLKTYSDPFNDIDLDVVFTSTRCGVHQQWTILARPNILAGTPKVDGARASSSLAS